ncbi:glutamine amidotransferase-related protein [Vibrio sp. WJH972]
MKIGIIVCGLVDPLWASDFGEYADMIQTTLSPYGEFEFQTFNALTSSLPEDIHACDGYIVTGSVYDAYADEPWIHQLADWIRRCDKQRKPLLGICFGHQIIALALGGKVEKSSKGWGIGISTTELLADTSWMEPKLTSLKMLISHQDQVIDIPPSMKLLARSDFCPNYMLSKDQHILTVQGHPEFSLEFERCIVEKKKTQVSEECYLSALTSLNQTPDSTIVMRWFANFLSEK